MANRRRRTDIAADEALEARLATAAFVNAVIEAVIDDVINVSEHHDLARLGSQAMHEAYAAQAAIEDAAARARVAYSIECGDLDTAYLRSQAQDAGLDSNVINEAIQRETAAA